MMVCRAVRRPLLTAGLGLLVAAPAAAQGNDRSAVVRGVVYDSLLTSAPLEGAEVWIEGTNRMARSDAGGRFELNALLPGRYTLTFYHPILDSVGVSASPVIVDVGAGEARNIALATPSPAKAHRLFCPRDPSLRTGALLSVVRNASSGKPLAAVTVSAHWTAYNIGEAAMQSAPRVVQARSDAAGHVLLCGIPSDVALLIQGRAADGSGGMLLVDLAGRAFRRADIYLDDALVTGLVSGVVRNRNGSLVPKASIVILGTETAGVADDFGRFEVRGRAGSRVVEARAVGSGPGRTQATIRPGSVEQVEIMVGDSVTVLDPIIVEAEYEPYLTRMGFTQRRRTALGHFLDTADVNRTGAMRFEEVFRMVPGVSLRPNGSSLLVELKRGEGQIMNPRLANYCPPVYFIDGVRFSLPPVQTPSVPLVPQEVLAIEVYANMFSAPPQYQRRDSGCGVILVWTKRGVPKRSPAQ
jgi:hypothetical protein